MTHSIALYGHLEAAITLASLWGEFRRIERSRRVENAHAGDYSALTKALVSLSARASQVLSAHDDDLKSRASLMRDIERLRTKLEGRVPHFVEECLCA